MGLPRENGMHVCKCHAKSAWCRHVFWLCEPSQCHMQVHAVKRTVEAAGAHRCCVVYGALPPEARSQQAALFKTPRSGFNVLAASDAVGMGLNLNIRCGPTFRAVDGHAQPWHARRV